MPSPPPSGRPRTPAIKVATWNVNGIRARQSQVQEWVERERPDVVCLQEIKATSDQVPAALCEMENYWCYWHGGKGYSGVGLHVSKAIAPARPVFSHPAFDYENRAVTVDVSTDLGAVTIASIYAPNGGKDFPAKMRFLEGNAAGLRRDHDTLLGLDVHTTDGRDVQLAADHVLAFFGLHPKLGPIADWGMELEKRALKVDSERFQTSVPGIFAVGDINTYPGKKKLILSGFHEAALAAFAIQHHLFPEKRQFLQYTTTSPIMQKRLGVAGIESDAHSGGI